jgi:arsenite-transporting ATPase
MLLDKLDALQADISRVQRTLKDHAQTQFVVVTIPTAMAVAETRRLVRRLDSEGIKVASLICNQVFGLGADRAYLQNRAKGQKKCIEDIKRNLARNKARLLGGQGVAAASTSTTTTTSQPESILEILAPAENGIDVREVPIVDAEATGVHGLRYFHTLAHAGTAGSAAGRKLNIFGGKGGVGKCCQNQGDILQEVMKRIYWCHVLVLPSFGTQCGALS